MKTTDSQLPTRPTAAESSGHSWRGRLAATSVLLLLFAAAVAILIFVFGGCMGEEFSPSQFRRRTFIFYRIPLIKVQITPVFRDDVTNPLESHLRVSRLIPPTITKTNQWAMTRFRSPGRREYFGDAHILCRYLDQKDSKLGSLRWLTWTNKHPRLAKSFWPVVADAARNELYELIPDLFEIAGRARRASQLKEALDRQLATNLIEIATDHSDLAEYQKAIDHFSLALRYDPDSRRARVGRAECYEQIGQTEKAAKDKIQVEKMRKGDS